jgi:hypothetical protein
MAGNGERPEVKIISPDKKRLSVALAGVAAIAAAGTYLGGKELAEDTASVLWNFNYGRNLKNIGVTIVSATGIAYIASKFFPESRVANSISDRGSAAMICGAVGVGAMVLGYGMESVGGDDGVSKSPDSSSPAVSVAPTEGVTPSTILDSSPQNTTITVNTGDSGYFLATPSGKPCEVWFPFNDPEHVAGNVALVQGGLIDMSATTGDTALNPGPADGYQGSQTNSALQHWRTEYLGVPEGQVFNLAQCDGLSSLVDGNIATPAIGN